jgi:hypothetical protein
VGLRLMPDQLGVTCDKIDGLIVYVDTFRVLDSNTPGIPLGKFSIGYGYRENNRETEMQILLPFLPTFPRFFPVSRFPKK